MNKKRIIDGDNASDPSSSLTAERMVESISSRSRGTSPDFGSAFKFDAGIRTTQGIGNVDRRTGSGSGSGIAVAIDSKSCPISSFNPGSEMGEWLELGLGSIHNRSKCSQVTQQNHENPNPRSVQTLTEDCSRPKKERNRAGFSLWSNEAEKNMCASLLNTPIQQFIHERSTQMDFHSPYGFIQSCYDNDGGKVCTISSSSCHQSYLDGNRFFSPETKFSAQYTGRQFEGRNGTVITTSGDNFLCQNSEQSAAVLQKVRESIQSRGQWSCNGDFARTKSVNVGQFVGPHISDISTRRKLLSIEPNGGTQSKTPEFTESSFMSQSKHKQTSAQFAGMQICSLQTENAKFAKPRRPKSGVWFMLQVAPIKYGDRLLPQIPKTYLRIKDETITILLVKRYLANKLGLKSESEIEITCKGQTVLPFLTLQHVRDEIWFSSMKKEERIKSLFPTYYSDQYLMILNYQSSPTGR